MNRRDFVQKMLGLSLLPVLSGLAGCNGSGTGAAATPTQGNTADGNAPPPSPLTQSSPSVPVATWSVPSGAVDVRTYGALGDGVNDDRAAIAAALAAVHNQGGGSISLPQGTYLLNSFSLPGQQIFFDVPPDVSIYGPGTLKVADNFGAWMAMFYQTDSGTPLNKTTYAGFVIDHNNQNNPFTTAPSSNVENRNGFVLMLGNGVTFNSVVQRNLLSRQAIQCFNVDNLTIESCQFLNDGIGDSTYDFDSSLLYIVSDGYKVTNCKFVRTGMGGRTALELHGRNFVCTGNQVTGFTTGIIIASDARFNRLDTGKIAHNTMTVREGISLWPCAGPIESLNILDNTITINRGLTQTVDRQTNSMAVESAYGIDWSVSQPDAITGLTISNNTIKFINENVAYGTWNGAYGIRLDPVTLTADLSQTTISNNQIVNAPGEAIWIGDLNMDGVAIQNNTMTDPETGVIPGSSGAAIYLDNSGSRNNVQVTNNQVTMTVHSSALNTIVQAPSDVQVSGNTQS